MPGHARIPAAFELIEAEVDMPQVDPQLNGERDLGFMLHDIDFANGKMPRYFRARMQNGVIEVPPFEEALA